MSEEEVKCVVLDPGSGYMKCGFAGDDAPRHVFKNMVGVPRATAVDVLSGGSEGSKMFVGDDAAANSSILDIEYCITDGLISNWDAFEACVGHALQNELRIEPSEYNVLLTEAPSNAASNREKMFGIVFDKFEVPAAQCQVQAVLSLYASGRTTGMVVDSGDGVSHTVPVFKGYGVRSAVCAVKNAGRNVSKRVLWGLNHYHQLDMMSESNGVEVAREVKEKICRVALDYDGELQEILTDATKAIDYEMPDGSVIKMKELIVNPAEVLFNPRVTGLQVHSTKEMIEKTINACNIEMRKEMYSNSVLSGGTTCLNGYGARVDKEFKEIVPENAKALVKVNAPEDRYFAVFAGGSILAGLTSFQNSWITKAEWEEHAAVIVEKKALF